MFKFYAVDPSAISRDLNTTNAICNLFGFSKVALSSFDHKYFKFCFDAVQINDKIRPNEQKRILNKIRTCILKSSIAKRKGRDKYNELLTFLKNVEKADAKLSFDGIISIDEISRPNWVQLMT